MTLAARRATHRAVSTSLALHSDRDLLDLLKHAEPLGSGIGGKSSLLEIVGTPVFVKRVPLTDLERQPEHLHSTANMFDLPMFCHYGIGGPGFGAWRELAVHTMTTDWVLTGEYEGFPLMYHWRVLPDSIPLPDELADVDRVVAYWGGGSQVRNRIEALRDSSASIALFLEYIPKTLFQWLSEQLDADDHTANQACTMVDRTLTTAITFMNTHRLLHFDTHFHNILTDGHHLYFTDFGLALSTRFTLAPDELAFFRDHETYDHAYTASYLVNWLLVDQYDLARVPRAAQVRAYAQGAHPTGIPTAAAALLARHAPTAAVMGDFFHELQRESRQTPNPLEEIHHLHRAQRK